MITTELFEALKVWVSKGDRCADIKLDNNHSSYGIWVYDYEDMSGKHVKEIADIPAEGELKEITDALKIAELQRRIDEIKEGKQ